MVGAGHAFTITGHDTDIDLGILSQLIPRVNYPAISKLVEETCRDFGIKYAEHRSFRAAMASRFRWLGRMGMPSAIG